MERYAAGVWVCRICLDKRVESIEYKYVVCKTGEKLVWECEPNRRVKLHQSCIIDDGVFRQPGATSGWLFGSNEQEAKKMKGEELHANLMHLIALHAQQAAPCKAIKLSIVSSFKRSNYTSAWCRKFFVVCQDWGP